MVRSKNRSEETQVKRICPECRRSMLGRRQNYTYTEAGLRSVVLVNIIVFNCECGAIVPEIPNASALHDCIALSILQKRTLITGEEIRFLRRAVGFSATDLARVIGMQKTSISRIENDRVKIGKDTDRLVRLVCFAKMMERFSALGGELTEGVSRTARMIKSLNLTSTLRNIENKVEGSKPVRIDPENAFNFGLLNVRGERTTIQ